MLAIAVSYQNTHHSIIIFFNKWWLTIITSHKCTDPKSIDFALTYIW